jgi:hypothetical protein
MSTKKIIKKLKELDIVREMCQYCDFVSSDKDKLIEYITEQQVDHSFEYLKPIMEKYDGWSFEYLESEAFSLIKKL